MNCAERTKSYAAMYQPSERKCSIELSWIPSWTRSSSFRKCQERWAASRWSMRMRLPSRSAQILPTSKSAAVAFLTVGLLLGAWVGLGIGYWMPVGPTRHQNASYRHAEPGCFRHLRGGALIFDYSGMVRAGGVSAAGVAFPNGVSRSLKRRPLDRELTAPPNVVPFPSCSRVVGEWPETGRVPSLLG